MRGILEKNSSPTSARHSVKIEYTSGGQPSPYELTFETELSPNPHFKSYRCKKTILSKYVNTTDKKDLLFCFRCKKKNILA